jgi:hypothetical protein
LPLLSSEKDWRVASSKMDKSPVEGVILGGECLVDLRAWGWAWFDQLGLPDAERKIYVVKCKFLKYKNDDDPRGHLILHCN